MDVQISKITSQLLKNLDLASFHILSLSLSLITSGSLTTDGYLLQ